MADRPINLQDIEWRDMFMFTRIFRAFRVAIRPSKMLLALVALLCMYMGGRALDGLWPQRFVDAGYKVRMNVTDVPPGIGAPFKSFLGMEIGNFKAVTGGVIANNWAYPGGVPDAISRVMLLTPLNYWLGNKLFFTLLFAWYLVIWAFFGGAIARIAAIHVARDEVISPLRALRFSAKAFPSFLAAPLIPFIMVLVLGVVIALMGVILYIPYVGPVVAGLLLIVPLVMGILMMLLTVGTIAGGGLMYPTIAVEGSDAFDAVSRALSHVFAAPWRLLFYSAVAVLYGAITYYFVRICVFVMLWLVHFFVGWFLTGNADTTWQSMWPEPTITALVYAPDWAALNGGGKIGAGVATFWVYLGISLLGAYVISFYFSANTIIYLLMRRKVDAAEMDQVYLEPAEDEVPPAAAPVPAPAPAAVSDSAAVPPPPQAASGAPPAGPVNPE